MILAKRENKFNSFLNSLEAKYCGEDLAGAKPGPSDVPKNRKRKVEKPLDAKLKKRVKKN